MSKGTGLGAALVGGLLATLFVATSSAASSPSSVCARPFETLCSSKSVRRRMLELDAEKVRIDRLLENLWGTDDFWNMIDQNKAIIRERMIKPITTPLLESIAAAKSSQPTSRQLQKLRELKTIGQTDRLSAMWNAAYLVGYGEIDLGRYMYVHSSRLSELVKRIAVHEVFHSVDPTAFFIDNEGVDAAFDADEYIFIDGLRELQSVFPVGYDLACLERRAKEGASVDPQFLQSVRRNPYVMNNTHYALGCGNGYASEAFADFMAHKSLLKGKTPKEVREYVLQQAVRFCETESEGWTAESDTHPSGKMRLENILFSFPTVRQAFFCE